MWAPPAPGTHFHRTCDPRSNPPNPNPPIGSTGPNVPAGFGDTHVMHPAGYAHSEAWQGWPVDWDTPWMESTPTYSTFFGHGRNNPDAYFSRVATVMTCVDRNSSQLASFPLYGVDDLNREPLPMWARNPMPGLYSDWSDFALEVANSMQLEGESIIWAADRYADGYPARFMCLPARELDVEYDPDRRAFIYSHNGDELDTADICHIRYQRLAGEFRGVGPLQWAWRHLVSAAALEDYATDIARHGVWAVLKNPANINSHQAADARTAWMAARSSANGAPAIVSGGWDFETVSLSPKDMALLDLRVLDDQRIAAAMRLQPYLVGVESPGSMTYDNTQWIGDSHWRQGLRPLAKKIATAISEWAIPGNRRMEFDRDEYVQPGFGERATAYATMHGIVNEQGEHAMTVDEVRVRERFDPKRPDDLPVGDHELVGSNP